MAHWPTGSNCKLSLDTLAAVAKRCGGTPSPKAQADLETPAKLTLPSVLSLATLCVPVTSAPAVPENEIALTTGAWYKKFTRVCAPSCRTGRFPALQDRFFG